MLELYLCRWYVFTKRKPWTVMPFWQSTVDLIIWYFANFHDIFIESATSAVLSSLIKLGTVLRLLAPLTQSDVDSLTALFLQKFPTYSVILWTNFDILFSEFGNLESLEFWYFADFGCFIWITTTFAFILCDSLHILFVPKYSLHTIYRLYFCNLSAEPTGLLFRSFLALTHPGELTQLNTGTHAWKWISDPTPRPHKWGRADIRMTSSMACQTKTYPKMTRRFLWKHHNH